MRKVRAVLKIICILVILIGGISFLLFSSPFTNRRLSHRIFIKFKALLLSVLSIKVHGEKFEKIGPGLIIANHRSYLDVLCIPTNHFFTIVGKVEIRSWPLIGWAGKVLGVIWVKRESKSSRSQTKQIITEAVKRGDTIVLFPEGTSSEGPLLMPVHPGMFLEAAKHGFRLYQWSLHFDNAKIAYPPGISFLKHLWETCQLNRVNVYIEVRQAPLKGIDGIALCNEAILWWDKSLKSLNEKFPVADIGYWPDYREPGPAIYSKEVEVKG